MPKQRARHAKFAFQVRWPSGRIEDFHAFAVALAQLSRGPEHAEKVSFSLGTGRLILRAGGAWEYWDAKTMQAFVDNHSEAP